MTRSFLYRPLSRICPICSSRLLRNRRSIARIIPRRRGSCTLARSMLPIGALLAFVTRQIGRLVQLAFNWATLVLFGQVAKDKQLFLSLMALLALVWPIALAGVALPSVGTFLLGFVTVPEWANFWVRIAMLALAVIS